MSSTGPVQRPVSLANPPARTDAPAWIRGLTLHTLDPDREASVAMASIPLPRDNHTLVAFAGMTSQALPIAWYPAAQGAGPGHPRQVRVLGIAEGGAPSTLGLVAAGDREIVTPQPFAAPATVDPAWGGPTWESVIVEEKKTGLQMREMNELVFAHAGRRLGIRLGIELTGGAGILPAGRRDACPTGGGYHWWEWLQVEQLWTGPVCTAIRAGGYIGVTDVAEEDLIDPKRYNAGYWFPRHNWLMAEVYAECFANGLVRVTARHVNNRFFDQVRRVDPAR